MVNTWKATKDLVNSSNEVSFTKGKSYPECAPTVKEDSLVLYNNMDEEHLVTGEWAEAFVKNMPETSDVVRSEYVWPRE